MLPFTINLKNKVAVVTGGGGLICGKMSRALAECGAKVAILDLSLEAAERVAQEIVALGGIAKAYACNVLQRFDSSLSQVSA